MKKLSKNDYIKTLEKVEKGGRDKIGLFGEIGLQGLSGIGSAAVASVLLETTVITTSTVTAPVLGSKFIGVLVGANAAVATTSVVAAPIAAVAAAGLGGMFASYYLIRLAKDGWKNDKRRLKFIKELQEKIDSFEESFSHLDEKYSEAKLAGIHALLLKLDAITVENSQMIFEQIESGIIDADFAIQDAKLLSESIIESVLTELSSAEVKKSLSKEQIKELEYLEKAHKDGFLSDVDFEKRVNDIINAAKEQAATKEGFLSNVDFEKTAENISNAVGEKATVALDLFKDAKKGIANVDFEKTAENISNTVGEKATVALDLFKDAKKDISNVDFEKTSGNISNAVSEKATVALDLFKDAKKGIFNRFK